MLFFQLEHKNIATTVEEIPTGLFEPFSGGMDLAKPSLNYSSSAAEEYGYKDAEKMEIFLSDSMELRRDIINAS